MPYQVLAGPTKDAEYDKYVNVLEDLGLPTERDASGRIGVVADETVARQILARLQQRMSWLEWEIVNID